MTSRSNDRSDRVDSNARLDHAALLLDLVTMCNEAVDTKQALQWVIDRICDCAGLPVGHAYLASDADPERMRSSGVFNTAVSDNYAAFHHRTLNLSFRIGEGMAGRALESGAPIWIYDFPNAHFARSQAAKEVNLTSGWAIPIVRDEHKLGVLEFFWPGTAEPESTLTDALMTAAGQVGCVILRERRARQAIERALAEEELRRCQAAKTHIEIALEDDHPIAHKLDSIAARIASELEVDAAHVLLCDAANEQFDLLPAVSPAVRTLYFPTERHKSDPARRAALDCEPVHIDNSHDLEPHEALPAYMSAQGVRSYYAVPLQTDGRLNGILELCCKLPRRRDHAWLNTLNALAEQTAIALDQYRADIDALPGSSDLRKAA